MDSAILIWFILTAISVLYIAYDLIVNTPEMTVMKWGWVLVALYTGPVALAVYWFSCREPAPGTHDKFTAPLWKQSVGSTIHCLAGDATGIIVAATVTSLLHLPMGLDSIVEYVAGFAFGLFVFQALFMKDMLGGSYGEAVRATWLPEWLSMNAVMSGMIPVMMVLMTRDMENMEPTSLRFWAVMSAATLTGALLAFPVNFWLVKNKLKHGMGTERALGKGGNRMKASPFPDPAEENSPIAIMPDMPAMAGMPKKEAREKGKFPEATSSSVSLTKKSLVALLTVGMLAAGVTIAGVYGDFFMRAGAMPMPKAQSTPTAPMDGMPGM